MMAPPTPVPMATMRALRLPRAAPKRASAHPKALASFSTTTALTPRFISSRWAASQQALSRFSRII